MPLTESDLHQLMAAQGWLELGNHLEAGKELEKITPTNRDHPDVLEVRIGIFAKTKKWENCINIASLITKIAPDRPTGWIQRSFALHELKRTQEAFDNLLPAAEKFTDLWTIPYNLACYCAQLGRISEAQEWFKKAILIDEKVVHQLAPDDPDLKPLWDSMSGTHGK